MRKDRVYIGFLVLAILIYAIAEIMKPKPVDWSPDFTKYGYIPFSTHILHEELPSVFPENGLSENTANLFDRSDYPSQSVNWIFLNSSLTFDEYETEVLLDRVRQGDHMFLAGPVNGALQDSLNLEFEFYYSFFDSAFTRESLPLSMKNKAYMIDNGWEINARGTYYHITSYDTTRTTELGSIADNLINFIRTDIGEGSIYVNSTPFLFTNYYMRDPESATYGFAALSHLPERATIWDEYYKDGRQGMDTPIYVILNTKSLRQAWFIAIAAILLFMLFRTKRVQRIIPILSPPKNSSLSFARTISQLYQEQSNHREILNKRIQFFYDYVKSNLRLDISDIDEKFKKDLASRSGVEEKEIFRLFDLLDLTEQSQRISDRELKLVTDQIDQFYKKSQR